jgi:lipid-binding SYLF domain-containing protein
LETVTRVAVSNPLLFFQHLSPELTVLYNSCALKNPFIEEAMKKVFWVVLFALATGSVSFATDSAAQRAQAAATILQEIMATPDKGIPVEILDSAKCIAIVPSLFKGGFVFGVAHGRGLATCRTANGWSAPAPFVINGGSFGFQIGGQAVDLVMMIMNDRGMQALLSSQFKIGADASAAAGPVGRHVEGATDWKMRAEVLTYSRARGLFAGVTLNGNLIKQDNDATGELYGRFVPFKTILTGEAQMPRGGEPFVAAVRKAFATASNAPENAPSPRQNVPANPSAERPVATPAPSPAAPAATPAASPMATPARPADTSAPASPSPTPAPAAPSPTPGMR